MKRTFMAIMSIAMTILLFFGGTISGFAAENDMSFLFDLSVDGENTVYVQNGDVITVTFKLKRTDAAETFTMYAMQDEIRYDSSFFEYVEGSEILSTGIVSKDTAEVDQYREVYMNYLSMSGGAQWNDDELIGSFQLRVIADAGVTQITNQDYLVSYADGSGSYHSDAEDVFVILSTECVVTFFTNGGSKIDEQIVIFGETMERPDDPIREGFVFEGWYTDIHLTDEWDFESDTVQGNMALYAKWSVAEEETTELCGCCMWWLWLLLLLLIVLTVIYYLWRRNRKKKSED